MNHYRTVLSILIQLYKKKDVIVAGYLYMSGTAWNYGPRLEKCRLSGCNHKNITELIFYLV